MSNNPYEIKKSRKIRRPFYRDGSGKKIITIHCKEGLKKVVVLDEIGTNKYLVQDLSYQ